MPGIIMTGIILLAMALGAEPLPREAAVLTYTGKIVSAGNTLGERRDDQPPVEREESFTLSVLQARAAATGNGDAGAGDSASFLWVVEEDGQPNLSWVQRFGKLSPASKPAESPHVLFRHASNQSLVPLPSIISRSPVALAPDAAWSDEGTEYAVEGMEKKQGRDAWRVSGRSRFGVGQTLWYDEESKLLVAGEISLVLGQGERYLLTIELSEAKPLDGAQTSAATAAFDPLFKMRELLRIEELSAENHWSQEQLSVLAKNLPSEDSAAGFSPLAAIAKAAALDLREQKNQSGALSALANKIVGKPAPAFELQTLKGDRLALADLGGAVTILHFWTYRDAPLEEPYGQVGYLDYLYRQHKAKGVKVYGVAVDDRFDDADKRRAAIGAVKRFQEFMNLDYPLLVDGGDEIEKFGDPRVAGAKLPLVVVIDAEGKVSHYHAGFYEVQADRGLEALEAAIRGK
jgi:peroxiredoxin